MNLIKFGLKGFEPKIATLHIVVVKDDSLGTIPGINYKSLGNNKGIIYQNIKLPDNIGQEGLDAINYSLRKSIDHMLNYVEGTPHVLIRKNSRGNLKNNQPIGYIAEMTSNGPILHYLPLMDNIPILGGYGSLLDPLELAANTADGDLRNEKNKKIKYEKSKKRAQELDITNKMDYVEADNIELIFNRAPTAERYGNTQAKRNKWAVLNSNGVKGKKAYFMIFDPANLTKDPKEYLARENYDEIEYGRKAIPVKDVKSLSGKQIKGDKIWILDSPLITDVYDNFYNFGKVQFIVSSPESDIKDNYIDMITNGLAGANAISPEFVQKYLENTVLPNGKKLKEHYQFMQVLERKLK